MKALSEFYDLLLTELPGCTTDMVDFQLVQVASEFCGVTSAWRQAIDPISLVAGQATYDLDSPETKSDVVRVTKLSIGTTLLWQDKEVDDRGCSTSASPRYMRDEPPFTLSPDLLELTLIAAEVPTADLVAGMTGEAALKPALGTTMLPDFLKSQHSETMRFGVLSRLKVMGGVKWMDRPLAAEYRTEWIKALNLAAYQGQVGNTRRPLRVRKWG